MPTVAGAVAPGHCRIRCPLDGWPRSGEGPAADLLWSFGSPMVYRKLVRERDCSPARFESWFADMLCRTSPTNLLPSQSHSRCSLRPAARSEGVNARWHL